jgi:hypothetical protein
MAETIWEDENREYGEKDLEELGGKNGFTSRDVKELAGALRERLEKLDAAKDRERKKKLKSVLKTVEKDCLPRKKKYEKAKRTAGGRNSYSRTDPDATFMRMKEDHPGNGQLKPAYNVQTGTENGFVVGYDIFPNPSDTRTLKPHLRKQKKRLGQAPKRVIADAGYGSEENFAYLENKRVTAIVKYPLLRKEESKKWQEDPWRSDNREYHEDENYYVCPNGRKVTCRGVKKEKTPSGYVTTKETYICESCTYCRKKRLCKRTKGNRWVEWNEKWQRLKAKSRRALKKHEDLRKQRSVEVETVFGQIKGNQGYRRFLLRGNAKVSAEWGLFSLGYDIKQMYRINRQKTG